MRNKNGISLIVLIVTIIVMIIIAGAVILTLTDTNVIDQAETAVEKHNLSEMKSAAIMAYSNWLLEEKTGKNPSHVQNYIRNELIKQGVATWDDFSKYYITETGGIEEIDQESFIYIVDIPDNNQSNAKEIELSVEINFDVNSKITIDWGDEQIEDVDYTSSAHIYQEAGRYEIKVTGAVNTIDLHGSNYFSGPKVVTIKSFGNLGLNTIFLWYTENMQYMSVPNSKSFENLEAIYFSDSGIQEIPDYLFKGCNSLTTVDFSRSPNLKYIPEHLFEGVDDVSAITKTFPEGLEVPAGW